VACTSTALDAAPPAGATAGWWQNWAFADGFHPTPYGHRLLAASVSRALARAGWL
jgi:phospholipase/lecithinase/hemolysin